MAFSDLLGNRQADASAGELRLGMEALKNHEDAVVVFRRDANPVVPNHDFHFVPSGAAEM